MDVTEMRPIDLMSRLPTEELKAQFFKELMEPVSDPLAPLPSAEAQEQHRTQLMAKYIEKLK